MVHKSSKSIFFGWNLNMLTNAHSMLLCRSEKSIRVLRITYIGHVDHFLENFPFLPKNNGIM